MTELKYCNSFSHQMIYLVGDKILLPELFMLGSCFEKSLGEQRLCYFSLALLLDEEFVQTGPPSV